MTDDLVTTDDHPHLPSERKRPGVPREGEKRITLTPNREAFLQAYLDTGKKSRAYMIAFKVPDSKTPEWVYAEAFKLLRIPQVSQRLAQIKAERAAAQIVNAQTLVRELDQARDLALEDGQVSVAVSATMGKARITGHLAVPEGGVNKGAAQNGGVNAGVNIQIVFNQTDAGLL